MQKSNFMRVLCMVVLLAGSTSLSYAQQAQDVVRPFIGFGATGARAAGLGQAFSGVADDFSAMYYNPAGLAHITWAEFSVGGSYYTFENSMTTYGSVNQQQSVSRNYMHTNSVAYVWPAYGMKFTLGLGYHNVAMMNRAFDIRGQVTNAAIEEESNEESSLGAYTISAGYQLQKEISVGLSFHLYSGGNTYSSDLYIDYASEFFTDQFIIDDSYSGIGATLGVLFAPTDYLRTGLSFTTPKFIDVDETLEILTTNKEYNYNFQYQSPPEIRLGQSVSIANLLVAGNVTWKDWSLARFRWDNNPSVEFEINNTLREDYASVLEYAAGVEFLVPVVNLKLRGGVHYIPYQQKSGPAEDQVVYSAGISVVLAQQFKIDAAYNRISWTENYSQMYDFENLDGKAEIVNGIGTLNLSYRF